MTQLQKIIFYGLTCILCQASHAALDASKSILIQNLQADTNYLSSSSMSGRLTGSRGEKLSAKYIAKQFQQLGLKPAGDHGGYLQKFIFNANNLLNHKQQKANIQHGYNVLATLQVNPNSQRYIIIGAHLDHLGRGEFGNSRARAKEIDMIHPGADDNASGVACMIAAARTLSQFQKQHKLSGKKNILFAAWSGEEIGDLGSTYFIKQHTHKNIDAVINLDMVGHLHKKLILQSIGSSPEWLRVINKIKPTTAYSLQKDPYLPTDSTIFYLHGIPAINFFTGADDNYHTPHDTADQLNYPGMKKISVFLVKLTLEIENDTQPMSYQAVQKPHEKMTQGLRIYLGTIPDYSSLDIVGVRLSGVAKNSPADQAKLRQNDVIIEVAGKKIRDIYDYTTALNSLSARKRVTIIALRNKKIVRLAAVPVSR